MNGRSLEFPRQELVFQGQGSGFCLPLKRNCSITPAGLFWAYGLIAFVTTGMATALAVMGAWPVLSFAGAELVALGIAFVLNGRRLEIGRHLHEQARRDLADELNRRLRN